MPKRKRVALCVTCLVDQIMPEVGVATLKLLKRVGFGVDFPVEQTCCGQPFFNSGFREQAVHLAKRTIRIFKDHDFVVLPSGSCTAMIRVEYPHLLEDSPEWVRSARELSEKTFELTEFLFHHSDWDPSPNLGSLRIAYHDSCHMCRLLMIKNPPRNLLSSVGCELVEMEESDRCCGFGGLFSIRIPEVSNAMTREKLVQARETGAELLLTADPGCLMQMRGLYSGGKGFRIEHIAAVLEEGTR